MNRTGPLRGVTFASIAVVLSLVLTSCDYELRLLRVGSKNFTESQILAEMIAILAEAENIQVKRVIPFGDEIDTFEGIKQGIIDVYPEYNGTGLVLLGQAPLADSVEEWKIVREAFADMNLEWGKPFGFEDNYALAMRQDDIETQGIESISDLAKFNDRGIRFSTDETFPVRPLDGLEALLRRYGLRKGEVQSFAVGEGKKPEIYAALLGGGVDVAEVYTTDGEIEHFGLKLLKDDLSFFPRYAAAPLVRRDALENFPRLSDVLGKLENRISETTMRRLNFAVDFYGETPRSVALSYLAEIGLIEAEEAVDEAAMVIAVGEADDAAGEASYAWRAIREVYSQRPAVIERAPNPMDLVARGEARMGEVSGEALFEVDGDRAVPRQGLEAVGVLGYRLVHLITKSSGPASLAEMKRLGVGQANSASDRVAQMILVSLGLDGAVVPLATDSHDIDALFSDLRKDAIDGVLLVRPQGHSDIASQMAQGDLKLVGLPEWTLGSNMLRFSFLRASKIPQDTYQKQYRAVDSISLQVVLAAPSQTGGALGSHGPVAVESARVQPLAPDKIMALSKYLNDIRDSSEQIDPALPVSDALRRQVKPEYTTINPEVDVTIMNLVFLVLMIAMIVLMYKKEKPASPGSKQQTSDIKAHS